VSAGYTVTLTIGVIKDRKGDKKKIRKKNEWLSLNKFCWCIYSCPFYNFQTIQFMEFNSSPSFGEISTVEWRSNHLCFCIFFKLIWWILSVVWLLSDHYLMTQIYTWLTQVNLDQQFEESFQKGFDAFIMSHNFIFQ
jgi:hypothetical protein